MSIREEFEAWLLEVHGLDSVWQEERNCFADFPAHLAYQAWQASREAAEQSAMGPELQAMLSQFEADENAQIQRAETFVRATSRASISAIQRNFKLNYGSACRLMDKLVARGIVSPIDSEGRRSVLPEVTQ
jgi:DNA segregation ATPase FtsK/SpoIIIE-like protein